MIRLCQVLGCDTKHYARGMCRRHYGVWRYGTRAPLLVPQRRYAAPQNATQAPLRVERISPAGNPTGHLPPLAYGGHIWSLHGPVACCMRCYVHVPTWSLREDLWMVHTDRWCPQLLLALPAPATATAR